MALKVEIGIMDLVHLVKWAECWAKTGMGSCGKKDFETVIDRLPEEAKYIALQDKTKTIEIKE